MKTETIDCGPDMSIDLVNLGYFASDTQTCAMAAQVSWHEMMDTMPTLQLEKIRELQQHAREAAMSFSLLARACERVLEGVQKQ